MPSVSALYTCNVETSSLHSHSNVKVICSSRKGAPQRTGVRKPEEFSIHYTRKIRGMLFEEENDTPTDSASEREGRAPERAPESVSRSRNAKLLKLSVNGCESPASCSASTARGSQRLKRTVRVSIRLQ